jgi:hypothetical protein
VNTGSREVQYSFGDSSERKFNLLEVIRRRFVLQLDLKGMVRNAVAGVQIFALGRILHAFSQKPRLMMMQLILRKVQAGILTWRSNWGLKVFSLIFTQIQAGVLRRGWEREGRACLREDK